MNQAATFKEASEAQAVRKPRGGDQLEDGELNVDDYKKKVSEVIAVHDQAVSGLAASHDDAQRRAKENLANRLKKYHLASPHKNEDEQVLYFGSCKPYFLPEKR